MSLKSVLILLLGMILYSCENEPTKILIIGDSISLGYTPHVKELLGDKAIVVHNKDNAQHTGTGIANIEAWIGDEDWDIIQFNWGLWDLAYRHLDSKNQGQRDKINGTVTYTPKQYGNNLDSIVTMIKRISQARLLFVTTSYVPEGEVGRFVKDAPIYNKVAMEVMKKHHVAVNDLYEYSRSVHKDHSTGSDNVHYVGLGSRQLAKKIIEGLAQFNRSFSKLPENEKILVFPGGQGGLNLNEAVKKAEILRINRPEIPIEIHLLPGDHYVSESIEIGPRLNGIKIVGSDEGEVRVKGSKRKKVFWQLEDGLLVAKLKGFKQVHQLYVNGSKKILARYPDYDEDGGHWQGHAADALSKERIASWGKPQGVLVHAMHGSEWGGFHYRITDVDDNGFPILEGGHQNNRPYRMHERYRMVENVFEELDAPDEFYFNPDNQKLYWKSEQENIPNNSFVEIPILKELFFIRGTKDQKVSGISIEGIQFSQSKRTFMEVYEPLLRSDWTIYRGGAIFLENAEDCEITSCEFSDLGGNGIFISGYNRDIRITKNHIHDLGATGVAFVGLNSSVRSPAFQYSEFVPLESMDTVRGPKTEEYPADCIVDNNLIYRIGRIEKQVAGVQLSMSMDITVSYNSIYDVPRAGINISEGTWGGHILEFNDVFMTVQESGDHGSFNSWGRDRFWHPNRGKLDELTSQDPQMPLWDAIHTTIIRNNRFRCDHGWDIDLDDGSSNYEIYNNLCLNGGIKLREGFYRKVENNIMINNGFHPHVWFINSGDIFRKNIVMTDHKDIRLLAWGKEVDYNLFPSKNALDEAQANGTDKNSQVGNPDFIAPEQGDFRVSDKSPALALGFKNFDMEHFGVQEPALKKIRKEPEIPTLIISNFKKDKNIRTK